MLTLNKYVAVFLTVLLNIFTSQYSYAHVMVAQQGTLNFVDGAVYMVLSLPVTAFEGIDDNHDGKLSKAEFEHHQRSIAVIVQDKVVMSDSQGKLNLKGLVLSPISSHDSPKDSASQLIVMGKFELNDNVSSLHYQLSLFGNTASEQKIEITARYKARGLKQVMTFTPKNTAIDVFKT
ncbi:MAG: hypothetical protein ACI9UT_000900 [Flavobacteriales bacterium]|jgi:hypothetical protein